MRDAGPAELLLERDRELDSLRAVLLEAAGGDGRLALVEGPAGIGKSRLLAELRRAAQEDDVRVLSARGSELEREFPFGVVRQLFEPPLTDGEARERWLAGAAAPARAIFDAADSQANGMADALRPWESSERYLNFEEGNVDTRLFFDEDTWRLLRALRTEWDPNGLFLANHEIKS